MLLFLFGKDTFRSREKLREILARFGQLPKAKRNLQVLDCRNASVEDVQRELSTRSLFQEKKLLVLRNVFQNKDVADALFEQRETLKKSSDTILFFEQGEEDTHPLFSFLKEEAKSQEFKPLSKTGTLAWGQKEFKKYGKTAEQDAILLLVGETGNNLWRLSQEILKLAAFLGKRTNLHAKDLQSLLHLSFEPDIFATLDALALNKREKALELLSLHIKKGDEPLRILSMLATQCRRILEVQDLEKRGQSSSVLSLHPWAQRKASALSRNFMQEKLEQSFEKVYETDRNIKTGLLKPASALYLFAALG